jgi:uncharacterized integral membrane protein
MSFIKLIIIIFLLVIGISFAMANDVPVLLNLYFFQYSLPLSLVLLLALGIGLLLGSLLSSAFFLRIKYENKRLKQQQSAVEQEIASLRTVSIKS